MPLISGGRVTFIVCCSHSQSEPHCNMYTFIDYCVHRNWSQVAEWMECSQRSFWRSSNRWQQVPFPATLPQFQWVRVLHVLCCLSVSVILAFSFSHVHRHTFSSLFISSFLLLFFIALCLFLSLSPPPLSVSLSLSCPSSLSSFPSSLSLTLSVSLSFLLFLSDAAFVHLFCL